MSLSICVIYLISGLKIADKRPSCSRTAIIQIVCNAAMHAVCINICSHVCYFKEQVSMEHRHSTQTLDGMIRLHAEPAFISCLAGKMGQLSSLHNKATLLIRKFQD